MMLAFAMLFHFLVDALCGASMLGAVIDDAPDGGFWLIIAYDFLAFATQVLTGWLADKLRHDRWLWLLSILLVGSGATGGLNHPWLATVLLGLGNSLFHVSAGREVIRHHTLKSLWRARELGLFVAPGALGIGLGCMFPMEMYMVSLAAMFVILGLFLWYWPAETRESEAVEQSAKSVVVEQSEPAWPQRVLAAFMMAFCVLCRAASGFCGPSPWRGSMVLCVSCFLLVMGGKMAGGIIGDRWGHWRTGLTALVLSWVLLVIGGESICLALSAQFVANFLMAITLYVLVKLYPSSPGMMFGLAAAVLFPGAMMQLLPHHETIFEIAYLLACLSFGAAWWLCAKKGKGVCL